MVRGQFGEVDKWSSESAEMADRVVKFSGWKGPKMVAKRWTPHVGDVFRFVVKLFQRVHRLVDRAAEWQRWITTVSVAAQFFWATKQGSVEAEKDGEEEDKVTKKQRKKRRQQAGLRLKAK